MRPKMCYICNKEVTNPICSTCYTRHFILWLNDYRIGIRKRIKIIKKRLFFEDMGHTFCIVCHKKNVAICTYCFFSNLEGIIKRLNVSTSMAEDFLQTFNYPLYEENVMA